MNIYKMFLLLFFIVPCFFATAQGSNTISRDSLNTLREQRNLQKGLQRLDNLHNVKNPSSVRIIDLSHAPLEHFPKEIFKLDSLQTLNLSYTAIDKIPNLKKLKFLENLYLEGMKIALEDIRFKRNKGIKKTCCRS